MAAIDILQTLLMWIEYHKDNGNKFTAHAVIVNRTIDKLRHSVKRIILVSQCLYHGLDIGHQ